MTTETLKTVTLYTKPTCSYCIAAKELLDSKGIHYTDIAYGELSADERAELSTKTNGYRTVPQIFIGDVFIGGYDQLNKLNRQAQLDSLLAG